MLWTGLILGLMSSLHCIGMCGPIALALPVPEGSSRVIGILLYNSGRIITYSMLGLVFGTMGYIAVLSGLQQYLSIVCGSIVIVLVFVSFFGKIQYLGKFSMLFLKFKNKFSLLLKKRTLPSLFLIGILNGLLPCGMVYMALVGAIATGSSLTGSVYMILFGLGTFPLMFLVFYVNTLATTWRKNIKTALPVLSLLLGVLLIVRGLNLNIPFLSPGITDGKISCCSVHKCHQ
ncbi:MAG TPA: sulfite exporter TauE/SafE family protein [Cytophagaceae bacterium]|nr:sulfite exporter TauE/SafE family protein [Cytophagaceae bacterium]